MKRLFELGDFVRRIYLQRRFGELSPLQLLRVEVSGPLAACDWLTRTQCTWDADRPPAERARNSSLQAIQDALSVRDLLFASLSQVESAAIRVFRRVAESELEMVITGTMRRGERSDRRIRSLAMQAKLCGLKFLMSDLGLEALPMDDRHAESPTEFVNRSEIFTNGGSSNAS